MDILIQGFLANVFVNAFCILSCYDFGGHKGTKLMYDIITLIIIIGNSNVVPQKRLDGEVQYFKVCMICQMNFTVQGSLKVVDS